MSAAKAGIASRAISRSWGLPAIHLRPPPGRGVRLPAMPEPASDTPVDIKPRSWEATQGSERAPARAMLRAIGMTDDDWDKAQVGVCSSWNEVTPCNMPLDRLGERAKGGGPARGALPTRSVPRTL